MVIVCRRGSFHELNIAAVVSFIGYCVIIEQNSELKLIYDGIENNMVAIHT